MTHAQYFPNVALAIAGSIAFLLGLTSAEADPQTSISGWESLSFDMTPQDVQAAMPGIGWKSETMDPNFFGVKTGKYTTMDSVSVVQRWNHSFHVHVEFEAPNYKIGYIALDTAENDPIHQKPLAACGKAFEVVLLSLEKKYGTFVPIAESLAPDNPFAVGDTLAVKTVAGGSSKYDFLDASANGIGYTSEAKTSFGPPGVNFRMNYSASPNNCSLTVRFNSKSLDD